ncbi:MAG: 16S rRNA (cytosine(1402)-N(4))-methyltransferase RsmH [Microthrixaceae bacterium]
MGVSDEHDDPQQPVDPPPGNADFQHVPVLLDRVVEVLSDVPPGLLVDATLGGAGHAEALLDANPGLRLLGIDRDPRAIAAATDRLARFGDRVEIVRSPFSALGEVVAARIENESTQVPGTEGVSAVLMDLGVSSPQIDEADRGFSYRAKGPLDMRMDRRDPMSADDVVNGYSHAQLRRVISTYGEDRFAQRIARAIVDARPINDTVELADVVRSAIPAPARRRGGDPAKRTFQAIRIEVNKELDELESALDAAVSTLCLSGRIAVLSYHSLEDRAVKGALREAETGGCVCPQGLDCVCGAVPTVRLLRRGAWKADEAEREANPRARSVRMRAAEAIAPPESDEHDGTVGWAS